MGGVANTAERELSPGRHELTGLDEDMLAHGSTHHPSDDETTVTLSVDADPTEVEHRVSESPLGKIMLHDGDSLLKPYVDPEEKAHDLIIGEVLPSAVEITAYHRSWRSTPPFTTSSELVDYINRWMAVGLWYGERTDEQKGDAVQYLGTGTNFNTLFDPAEARMGRLVVARGRINTDRFYRGHNQKRRYINDRKALQIAGLMRELFELRRPEGG